MNLRRHGTLRVNHRVARKQRDCVRIVFRFRLAAHGHSVIAVVQMDHGFRGDTQLISRQDFLRQRRISIHRDSRARIEHGCAASRKQLATQQTDRSCYLDCTEHTSP